MITKVQINRKAQKQLKRCPRHIIQNLYDWVEMIALVGLEETRKIPSLHDEALQGNWFGFRSIRLNIKYRAIYKIVSDQEIYIEVVEVTPHEYKK